mmetsp:Transcript_13908/g.10029  ORF Transcript_13908/g.10029 Transcript_13908/m.10029 type:complete len:126 (+) Transcript_13908:1506-1883(+)
MGMDLIERDAHLVVIENANKQREEFKILAIFPFSSSSKRMGIIVEHNLTGKIIFYLKGAETVMKTKVKPIFRATIDEACDNLAQEGLRTLVIAQRTMERGEFNRWLLKYQEAQTLLENRESAVAA